MYNYFNMFTEELIALFGDAQELIVPDLTKNIKNFNDYLSIPGKNGADIFFGLLNDLKKISDIVEDNQRKCILEIPSGKQGEFLRSSITLPVKKNKVKDSLKILHNQEISTKVNNKAIDTSSETKLDEIYQEIYRLDKQGEKTNKINGVKLTIQNPPEFQFGTYNAIYDLYTSAISKINTLNEAIEQRKKVPANKEIEPNLTILFEYLNQITKLANSHFSSFNAFKPNECKSIEDMFSFTRNIVFDTDAQELEEYGGNQSSRLKTEITLPDGTKRKGFFTRSEKFDYDKSIDDFLESFSGQYRDYDENFFNVLFSAGRLEQKEINDVNRTQFKNAFPKATDEQIEDMVRDQYASEGKRSILGTSILNLELIASYIEMDGGHYKINIEKLEKKKSLINMFGIEVRGQYLTNFIKGHKDDEDFCIALMDFAKKSKKFSVSTSINKDVIGMKKGFDISIRNCAMTAVEEALGMKVLADSYKMSIGRNNELIDGVFMENAQGTDFLDLPSTDKRLQIKSSECQNPELLKSIADLQILDFICGNVDRHAGNYFIKFDENNDHIIGVCGIDNDSSFSIKNPENDKNLHVLMPLNDIKVVTRKTADALEKMTPDLLKAVLKPFNLTSAEIIAANRRLSNIKDAIANGKDPNNTSPSKIRIVEDNQWKDIDINSLKTENNTFGKTFKTIEHVAKTGTYISVKEEELTEKAKILTNKTKHFKKDLGFYANELELFKSSFWNSRKYRKIIKKLNQLKKKNFEIGYMNFGSNPSSKAGINKKINEILSSIAQIKKLAQDYLTHKKNDIENNTLDEVSRHKVRVVKNLIKTMEGKEKAFTVDYQNYVKEAQVIAMKNQEEIRRLENDDLVEEKTHENQKTNVIDNEVKLNQDTLNHNPNENIININGINNPNNNMNVPEENNNNKHSERKTLIIKEEAQHKNNIISKEPVIDDVSKKEEIKKSEPKYVQNPEENVRNSSTIAQLDLRVDMGEENTTQDKGYPTIDNYKDNLDKRLDQFFKD